MRKKNRQFQHQKFNRNSKSNAEVLRAIYSGQKASNQISEEKNTSIIIHNFSDFPICDILKTNILKKGYLKPLPIQDQCIPEILKINDVVGIASTGTGKTAAFLIPLIDKIYKDRTQKAIIITPTRELAVQINQEFKSFSVNMNLYSTLCIGGLNINGQKRELSRNPHLVIGTPGRIKDLIKERALNLIKFNNVVLDEVDRMLDIGFIKEIKYFISLMPKFRQSLFFSATFSHKAATILKEFSKNPITISVANTQTRENIKQNLIKIVNKGRKTDQLQQLLNQKGFEKVIIFGRTKHGIQKLTDELIRRGFKAGVIHGNKRQSQRQKTLDQFKNNEIKILLATDIASRGLDINGISHVINYDIPATYEDYIHRIGRTGRMDNTGAAITFVE